MSRKPRSEEAVEKIAMRFFQATNQYLEMDISTLWKTLGYANPSTIQSIKNGKTLPDFIRIVERKSAFTDIQGRSLNLHWVLTGEGAPMLKSTSLKSTNKVQKHDDIIIKIKKMPPKKREALKKFLVEFS